MNALQSELVETIRRFCAESPYNRLSQIDGSAIFDEPLVGFAAGNDPLFTQYQEIIGPFHLTPARALPGGEGETVSVVSWVLPTVKETRRSNRKMDVGPSQRWNHTRFVGEDFNNHLRRHVVAFLESHGYRAIAPVLSPLFRQLEQANGPTSTWSERHVAFAAGLGTFSLSDGLITARGIAHRVGSVVSSAPFEPTPRPYQDYREYCRFARDGSCMKCAKRCPAGAITVQGHDKNRCNAYMNEGLKSWIGSPGYLGTAYVACGLCQTGVPCEHKIPV
jgi:epoxyqueuosine reductase